uniref:Transcription factor CBF/NF-Y/archaeal histone domain-containing protein n=1 Tax=Populus davidiana TaxID=266767 RepID=A0A6M2FC23_9ROSI
MQTDEDVGKIAMAVPLLVSKALELFLQDLCDRTYEITLKRGAKTLNSLHLKQCVQTFNVFDFLREIVCKVPDLGGPDAAGDERGVAKRRKVADDEDNDSDEECSRNRTNEIVQTSSSGRGRGRGRGRARARGRGTRSMERETAAQHGKFEDDPDIGHHNDEHCPKLDKDYEPKDSKDNIPAGRNLQAPVRDFDLNAGLDENGETQPALASVPASSLTKPDTVVPASSLTKPVVPASSVTKPDTVVPTRSLTKPDTVVPASSSTKPTPELKHEEVPGWSLEDIEKMDINPVQLANLNTRIDEEEEDYDEEDCSY